MVIVRASRSTRWTTSGIAGVSAAGLSSRRARDTPVGPVDVDEGAAQRLGGGGGGVALELHDGVALRAVDGEDAVRLALHQQHGAATEAVGGGGGRGDLDVAPP